MKLKLTKMASYGDFNLIILLDQFVADLHQNAYLLCRDHLSLNRTLGY
jgi:hypothetical protein